MRTVNAPVTLLVAAWLAGGASVALAAPPPAPPGPPDRPETAPPRAREQPPAPSPASARVQVDKVCPVAQEDAKRVVKMQAAERRAELLRLLKASVDQARGIAGRRWDRARERWIHQVYERGQGPPGRQGAPPSALPKPDLLPPSLCRAVARRAPAECAGIPQGDRLICEQLANGFQAQGGAEACPPSGPIGSACRFFKTHDLDAVRGTPFVGHAVRYLKAAQSIGALCDRARTQPEATEGGALTCLMTAVVTAVRDGLKACPEVRPGDGLGFRAVVAQCRAIVGGDAAACDGLPAKAREVTLLPAKFFAEARVFGSLSGPTVSVFLGAPTRQACVLELEASAWDGTARRFRVAGTTGRTPRDGIILAPAPVPAEVRPGQDARVVSKTCVPWAF